MFPAQPVTHVPYAVICTLVGIVLMVVYKIDRAKNHMIMDMTFINMRCQNILMLPFSHSVGKLPPDFMGLFRRCFPRLKGLDQMKG